MNYIYGMLMSWGMFTVIPCPYRGWKEEARGHMLVCLPIVGAIIGAIWFGVFAITGFLPIYLRAVLITIVPWFLTGFMHLDGFMDVCDAVMSRRDLETRQKILKDSRVGAFAVICIGILMLAQFAGVLSLLQMEGNAQALILIPVASRICAAFAVMNMKPMHTSQYSNLEKKSQFNVVISMLLMALIAVVVALVLLCGLSIQIIISVLATIVVYWICTLYGNKMLGGMNGDISGYALTLGELAGIIGLIL